MLKNKKQIERQTSSLIKLENLSNTIILSGAETKEIVGAKGRPYQSPYEREAEAIRKRKDIFYPHGRIVREPS